MRYERMSFTNVLLVAYAEQGKIKNIVSFDSDFGAVSLVTMIC